jgi:hypothetical protein
MRATSIMYGAMLTAALAACRHAEIPYDVSGVPSAATPIHAKRVAVLPFTDARTADDGPDDAERFVYQGVEYVHTELDDLKGSPLARITELVGRHLAASRAFAQVILVREKEQAPEADLILTGRVRRMRGYVEAEPPNKKSGRPQDERLVLAEVVLADIEVHDAKDDRGALLSADVGWSMHEPRTAKPNVPDPWAVLSEALFHAVSDLVVELQAADLSGAHIVKDKVAFSAATSTATFGALAEHPPEGWRFVESSTAAAPLGWTAATAACTEARLEQRQTLRFHRVLGSYRPALTLWACPARIALSYNALEEFPARYLGERADGSRYFVRALGESNWPGAVKEIAGHLALEPPRDRYVFELPAR